MSQSSIHRKPIFNRALLAEYFQLWLAEYSALIRFARLCGIEAQIYLGEVAILDIWYDEAAFGSSGKDAIKHWWWLACKVER